MCGERRFTGMELDGVFAWLGRAAEWASLHWQILAMVAAVWLIIILIRDRDRSP